MQVRAVCRWCNNGWMNDLDCDVETIVVPLIRNTPSKPAEAERILLARWATKVALLLEQTRSRSDPTRRRSLTRRARTPSSFRLGCRLPGRRSGRSLFTRR